MKIVLATILGFIASMGVNMAIINFGIPVTVEAGGDVDAVRLKVMESFTAMEYLIPLSAHIFGVLIGLIVARLICKTSNIPIYIVGGLHMIGTVIVSFMIPAPIWFNIVDLILPLLIILYFLRTKRKK